jgi:Zn-dependent peptidase ImmA (M78 family)
MPDVEEDNAPERSPEERYCNAFARNFLTPARALAQRFRELTAGASRLTRRHVIVLAHAFGVSREALVRRLEEIGLAKRGTWDWFEENGSISEEHAKQVLGDLQRRDEYKADANRPTSLRLNLLAGEVARQELLSEGQLSRLLQVTRTELRDMLEGLEIEGSAANEAPALPH